MVGTGPQFTPVENSPAPRPNPLRRPAGIVLVASVLTVAALLILRRGTPLPTSPPAAVGGRPGPEAHVEATLPSPSDYLGPEACAACHAERVAEFQATRHYQACTVPDPDRMPAGFSAGRGTFETRVPGLHFEM